MSDQQALTTDEILSSIVEWFRIGGQLGAIALKLPYYDTEMFAMQDNSLLLVETQERFKGLTDALAELCQLFEIDSTPYHKLNGGLNDPNPATWDDARALTKRLELKLRMPAGNTLSVPSAPPLGKNAAFVYELLLKLPPHRALTGPEICDALNQNHGVNLDETVMRTDIRKALEPYGIEHAKRIGYRIKPTMRSRAQKNA